MPTQSQDFGAGGFATSPNYQLIEVPIMNFLTQPRIWICLLSFGVTLTVYILRGLGILSFLPGMILLLLFGTTGVTLIWALRQPRRWW